MVSNQVRTTRHRRALSVGIGLSVAAHLVAIAVIAVPGSPLPDADDPTPRFVDETFEALEVVQLAEETPALTVSTATAVTAPASTTSGASGAAAPEASVPSLEQMLADLTPAQPSVPVPDNGQPIVTFRDLQPVSQSAAMMAQFAYGGGFDSEREEGGGGWSDFLGGIGAALSGGGHCPTPSAGPLIFMKIRPRRLAMYSISVVLP